MKIKKYIVIILIAIMTIFYSNINYASIPQSAPGGSGGSGYELDEYGRPKTIEDFINIISRGDMNFAIYDLLNEKCDREIKRISETAKEIKEYYRAAALIDYM